MRKQISTFKLIYFPIMTYKKMDSDPLLSLLNPLSQIAENEGALRFLNAMGFSARAQHVWLAKTLQKPPKKKRKQE